MLQHRSPAFSSCFWLCFNCRLVSRRAIRITAQNVWFRLQELINVLLTRKSHQSAFTTFCVLPENEHHVFGLVLQSESPHALAVFNAFYNGMSGLLMFTFTSFYCSESLGVLCLCVWLSLAALTHDGFGGFVFPSCSMRAWSSLSCFLPIC